MITKDDAINTVEFDNYYVIMPSSEYISWDKEDFINNSSKSPGVNCPYGMNYDSCGNDFLSIDELKKLIKSVTI